MTAVPSAETPTALSAAMRRWIESTAAGTLTTAERRPGGGRHEAWTIDVRTADGRDRKLFLRYNRSDPAETGDPFTLQREAAFYRALHNTNVPVPEIVGVHPVEQAVLSTRIEGQTWFSQLRDEGQRQSVAEDFMRLLAQIHEVDPSRLDVPGQNPEADLRELVRNEIDTWERLYRSAQGPPNPLLEFGLRWLRSNAPDVGGKPVIVQGDTGPGNFLYADGRVTAVLDWELAHLGDPHDDLGWLALRAVQEPFTDLVARFADYEVASGRQIDYSRVRYYRVFAEFRVVVLTYRNQLRPNLLGETGNALIYAVLHDRLLVEALADALGVTIETAVSLREAPTERTWIYDSALAQLKDVIVPRSQDPFVILRAKGIARQLKYLRQADMVAGIADAQALDELTNLLGERPVDLDSGRRRFADAVRSGSITDDAAIRQLAADAARRTELTRPAMGALADRHFDPLPQK